ncbi:MAG: hypothetical protein J5644_01780 [Bacteroidales bacterium]|nr:hypothetical protein [Bacteroidales bacterium]
MDPFNENKRTRSPWLVVLAVLTFINSGFSFLGYFSLAFSSGMLPTFIEMYESMGMPAEVIDAFQKLTEVPSWQYLLLSLGFALAVVGAALMLKIKKIGFHLYVISQIWLFVMCNLVIKGALTMGWMSIFTTVLIIVCYGLLMREALANQERGNQFADYEEVNEEQDDEDE